MTEPVVLLFLTSGLFLGWSLGANDAANVFGTAVGTGMVRFTTAAVVCSLFVILGAVISGGGAAHTLGKLGSVNALGGAFMVAFAAALTVYWMTKLGLPVSTSQAIVGAIIGWNLFSGSVTDVTALTKILLTWFACPLLAGLIAVPIFKGVEYLLAHVKIHLLRLDAYTRVALIAAGAFGAYSLGANNIANVMGVFVPSSPFSDVSVADLFTVSSIQQLFFVGALAIAVGVFTYSKKVMLTVGGGLLPLSPVAAWVVVISHSIVLFLFASEGLEHLLANAGLPTIPLVPVSSSQAVVGAVIGIGILKGARNVQWRMLGTIGVGWVATPVIAALLCFIALFFLQNVFRLEVYTPVPYRLSAAAVARLSDQGLAVDHLTTLKGQEFANAKAFLKASAEKITLDQRGEAALLRYAEVAPLAVDPDRLSDMDVDWFSAPQQAALKDLSGRSFEHKWQLADALAGRSEAWRLLEDTTANKRANKSIKEKLAYLSRVLAVDGVDAR